MICSFQKIYIYTSTNLHIDIFMNYIKWLALRKKRQIIAVMYTSEHIYTHSHANTHVHSKHKSTGAKSCTVKSTYQWKVVSLLYVVLILIIGIIIFIVMIIIAVTLLIIVLTIIITTLIITTTIIITIFTFLIPGIITVIIIIALQISAVNVYFATMRFFVKILSTGDEITRWRTWLAKGSLEEVSLKKI